MRLSLAGLVLGLATVVSALSATGNRLLVIAEDATDKSKYSQFLADVESMTTDSSVH
jgi:oligosaccharyltransferase complex subunit beta